ncbi:MAG: M3 family oligoendopeptidase [Phycisphaerales bacterium]
MTMTTSVRTCVPADLDGADWSRVEPVLGELLAREVGTVAEFEQWLVDRSEAEAACMEARANLFIASSCDTEDKAKTEAYAAFIQDVAPKIETVGFELDKKQVALAERFRPDPARYMVLERSKKAAVALFRAENVPIQTELDRLAQDYGKVAGAQTVEFDGAERTLPQMAVYQQSTDRSVRERAWRAVAARRMQDRATLDSLLSEMVARRDRMARNAGCADFVEYAFKEKQRFDYTPKDCERFWEAAAKHVVPLMRRLDEKRRSALKLDALRPWDLSVDEKGRPGLKPFDGGRELFEKSARVFEALDARLGRMFRSMGPADGSEGKALVSEQLDLDSRKGKRPGGYQYNRQRSRKTFIFMNAAGLQRDVQTMVHEAGHAFHSMLCAHDPLVEYRGYPTEFAEVASMSMEHLTMPYWGVEGGFYSSEEECRRARAEHLEQSVTILAWIATIDAFQHWMYRHPGHTPAERDAEWERLEDRFGHSVSWEGLREEKLCRWQQQSHLYSHPMYYIEYGIAQLGALRLWLKSRTEGERAAVDAYVRALALGGSRPLPDLFAAAGLSFDFGEGPVARVCEEVEAELERLA